MRDRVGTSQPPGPLRRLRWLLAYLVVLAASHAVAPSRPSSVSSGPESLAANHRVIDLPAMSDEGPTTSLVRVSHFDSPGIGPPPSVNDPAGDAPERPPIILIHGSPGSAADFQRLTPRLSEGGRRVIAIDLPGFGSSSRDVPSYSIRSHARSVLALMDARRIPRAHVVGWSMGGGVVLHMADLAPQRLASITLMAAIGSSENEGSRSYVFEHAKYRAGFALFMGAPGLVPHFGLLPNPRDSLSRSWLRNFDDTDMRPLRAIMNRLHTPTLVLHGRRDFLVPDWAAEEHASRIRGASLVMLDASHFLPFLQPDQTARHLLRFVRRHDQPGVEPVAERTIEAPPRAHATGFIGEWTAVTLRHAPWWAVVAVISLLSLRRPNLALVLAAVLAAQVRIDPLVGATGVLLGRAAAPLLALLLASRPRALARVFAQDAAVSEADWTRRFRRHPPGFWLGVRATLRPDLRFTAPRAVGMLSPGPFSTALFVIGSLAGAMLAIVIQYFPALVAWMLIDGVLRLDEPVESAAAWLLRLAGVLALFGGIFLLVSIIPLSLTWTGRRMLLAKLHRALHSEFWPGKLFYAPLAPYYAWLVGRTRRLLPYSSCNPAMSGSGGIIGESKHEIQSRLDASTGRVLPSVRVDAGPAPAARAASAAHAITSTPSLGGLPIIVKPDSGFRGFSVRIIRDFAELEPYFQVMRDPAMLQAYHPGPHEIGVLWARTLPSESLAPPPADAPTGFIYSITRKEFPFITGDGRHTLEQLIYRHPRLRCQASVFLGRFADDASRVLAEGERLRLAQSGNHCQGTLFRDGADLITPELSRAIDQLASSFPMPGVGTSGRPTGPGDPGGRGGAGELGGLDIGRFDLRFASEDDLRAGRNFSVIELNGTTGESTNVYDPYRSIFWRYRVLFGLWKLLFELGAWRAKQGYPGLSAFALLASLRSFHTHRTGSELAD